MINSSEQMEQPPVSTLAESLKTTARLAFAEHVRLYDEQDQVIVHVEPNQLRLVYLCVRASRQSSAATLVQCCLENDTEHFWINSLQVSNALRRQGLAREMVTAIENTAQAIGVSLIKVYPLTEAVDFWKSLGYAPDVRIPRVLQKELRQLRDVAAEQLV